ncbi:MAG TPA: Gfo/Idh/MocA family oxidoreductase [Clostridiales bacterium]|nr:Gfo/Idh/MocA family oxidoreductase [Clostridiales bacterium]
MKKLRMGVIGCGDITKYMMLLTKIDRSIKFAGFADPDESRARKFAARYKDAGAYKDYSQMIANEKIDAAYIAVPHYLHYPIVKDLISKGIHVLCEKPIVTALDHALELEKLAVEKQVKVGVNYQYRYDHACYRMVQAAHNGDLGRLYYGICNIPWSREASYFTDSKWHAYKETAGGGTLLTQGSHALDILLWAFNSEPVRAIGSTRRAKFHDVEVEDTAMGIVELSCGGIIQITSSMAAAKEQPVTITLYGEKGTAAYTGPYFSRVNFYGVRIPRYKAEGRGIHALSRSMNAFVKWVTNGTPYYCPINQSIPVLASVLAIYRSAESGKAEDVKKY